MSQPAIIKVQHVDKAFRLPHEKHTSVKSLFVNMFKGKRTYEKQHVLKDISFEVYPGEFFAIVGRNGSGKSTLLKLLAGIYTPNQGNIEVGGRLTPFIELGVGFNPELSGRDNVFLNGALLGFNRNEVEEMYNDIVDFAELGRFMDQKLKNYSSGMQVRLAFSIAIRAQSDILLLDEVLAVGDAAFQQKCFDYFEQLKRDKKTVVFVSHDMAAINRFCSRAIYLKDGQLIHDAPASEIAELYKLENIEPTTKPPKDGPKLSTEHKIKTKLIDQTADHLILEFDYSSKDNAEMYVGFAVLRDGISVAEMTTDPDNRPLRGSGKVTYKLDITKFNAGVYRLNTVLCSVQNRKLLTITPKPLKFTVGRADHVHGGALRLADTWRY